MSPPYDKYVVNVIKLFFNTISVKKFHINNDFGSIMREVTHLVTFLISNRVTNFTIFYNIMCTIPENMKNCYPTNVIISIKFISDK